MNKIAIDAMIVSKNERKVSIRYCYWIQTAYGKCLNIRFMNIMVVIDLIRR